MLTNKSQYIFKNNHVRNSYENREVGYYLIINNLHDNNVIIEDFFKDYKSSQLIKKIKKRTSIIYSRQLYTLKDGKEVARYEEKLRKIKDEMDKIPLKIRTTEYANYAIELIEELKTIKKIRNGKDSK